MAKIGINQITFALVFIFLGAVSRFTLLSFARASQKDIRCNRGYFSTFVWPQKLQKGLATKLQS